MELLHTLTDAMERLRSARQVKAQENGAPLGVFEPLRYELRGAPAAPLLQLCSESSDLVRRVLGVAEDLPGKLVLSVSRLGHARPSRLQLVASNTPRVANPRRAARERFSLQFQGVLAEQFPDETASDLTAAPNLRYSLSGNYARGLLGTTARAWALLAAAPGESAETYDGLLTYGLLWLDRVRKSAEQRPVIGLRLFLPRGADRITRHRLQALAPGLAVELYEYCEDDWRIRRIDPRDAGNLDSWLVHRRETEDLLAQAAPEIERLRRFAPEAIAAQPVPGRREVALRFRGVLFARWTPNGIFFGIGEADEPWTPLREPTLQRLLEELKIHRSPAAERTQHRLYRAQPERWLQTLVQAEPVRIEPHLDSRFLYAQVPALMAGDRGVVDLLGVTREGRLAVIELKASEDSQLVFQAVDYWLRVRWHQMNDDFPRYGYFPGIRLDSRPPLLFLVAPAIRFHPASGILLQFLAPEIELVRVGVSESWRRGLKVVLRQGRSRGI